MFELNCLYAGFKTLHSKSGREFLIVTLCFSELGAVNFFAPAELKTTLSDLDFGVKYDFIFSLAVRDGKPSMFISGVNN